MTDFNDERQLRAWAIEQVVTHPGTAATPAGVDVITAAQRIVDFVKGDGAAAKGEGA